MKYNFSRLRERDNSKHFEINQTNPEKMGINSKEKNRKFPKKSEPRNCFGMGTR
jgi:hypothetical protein